MIRTSLGLLLALLLVAAPSAAQDANAIIAAASKAIGAEGLNSVTFHGSGATYTVSQTSAASRTDLTNYRRTIDFTTPASRSTASSAFSQLVTPADQAWADQLEIWLTPWGFLRGAAANNATVRTRTATGERMYVVSWSVPGTSANGQARRVVGYLDAKTYLVSGIETWVEDSTSGTMHVQALFGGWRDGEKGVKFPSTVVQQRDGRRTFEAQVVGAEANPANLQTLMAPAAAPAS